MIAWAACSSEEAVSGATSEAGFPSMVRYSEQSEEKASLSVDGEAIWSDNDEVRRVTVRGVEGKKVGIP